MYMSLRSSHRTVWAKLFGFFPCVFPRMQLLVITSPRSTPNEAQICREMHQLGLPRLHLRKPGWSKSEAVTFLSRLDEGTLRSIVLHDWHELADEFPVKGVHYTEKTRPRVPLQARPPFTISTAFHELSQLQSDHGALNYAFLSPIFDSISKKGYEAAFDHKDLAHRVPHSAVPLVALGGISAQNVSEAKQLGFSAAAVLGSVWSCDDPVNACQQLLTACKLA